MQDFLAQGDRCSAWEAVADLVCDYHVDSILVRRAMVTYDKAETRRQGLEAMIRVLKETNP